MQSSYKVSAWRITIIALVLLSLLASCALAGTVITDLKVTNSKNDLTITITGNQPFKLSTIKSSAGSFLAFQIPGRLAVKGRLVGVRSGRVYNVRYSNFSVNPPASRIVINTRAAVDYCTEWSTNRKSVKITVYKFGRPSTVSSTPTRQIYPVLPEPEICASPVVSEIEQSQLGSDSGEETTPELKRYNPQPIRLAEAQPAVPAYQPEPETNVIKLEKPEKPGVDTNIVKLEKPSRPERKVSLNFLGADINDVLKALSVQSNYNIVSSKDVTGTITISLSNVDVETALDYIAKLSGYSYAKLDDTYVVGKRDSVRSLSDNDSNESRVELIALTYVKLDDMVSFLEKEFPDLKFTKGSKDDPLSTEKKEGTDNKIQMRGGIIIISGPNGLVDQAKAVALSVDNQMRDMISQEVTEVYTVKYVEPKSLAYSIMNILAGRVIVNPAPTEGFNLKAPSKVQIDDKGGASIKTDDGEQTDDVIVRALIISGREADVKQALSLAEKLDIKAPQIKIDAKITSITEAGEKKLGVEWSWGASGLGELGWVEGSKEISTVSADSESTSSSSTFGGNNRWARVPWNFAATLNALVTQGDASILASPSLTCLEGKPGVFFVGDEVTYITLVQVTATGTNVTTEKANVGVQLRVSGDVSPDGNITLNLHPEVSVLNLGYNEKAGIYLPKITRRFTDNVIRVKNGQTIAIGGLIRDDEIEEMSKVPILGDLPFVGKLFRNRHTDKSRSEVVMMITASIIEE